MAPKAAAEPQAVSDDRVKVLINLIVTADDFKANLKDMAPLCNIADAKNVPRKLNSVLNPFGYKFASGKIQSVNGGDEEGSGQAAKLPKTPSKATARNPRTPRTKEVKTPKKGPVSKKRKVEEEEEEEEEDQSEDADLDMAQKDGDGADGLSVKEEGEIDEDDEDVNE